MRVAEALSGIDVELTRRASLIPSLVHTVQTFAGHEKGILDHVTDARAALTSATTGKSVAQRSAAEKELDTALAPVLALGQSYPQLNSSNNFLNLQDNLADTEDKLAFARQYYNDAVATLNRLITHHPVDVRRPDDGGVRAGVLPDAPVERPYTGAVRIVFAGTPEPALPSLRRLIESPRHDVVAVLTRPDAASGRRAKPSPSPVARLALEHGIPVLRPARPNSDEFVAELTRTGARLLRGGGLRRAAVRAAAGGAHTRLGQPALLAAARLAGRRTGPGGDRRR